MFIYLCIYFVFGVNGLILWGRRIVGLEPVDNGIITQLHELGF